MRDIDHLFLEQMESDKFQKIISDDFSFADSLIDQKDLEKINNEEDDLNADND